MPERVGEVLPEEVLQLMDECQEAGGHHGRRDSDQRTEEDQAQVAAAGRHPRTL